MNNLIKRKWLMIGLRRDMNELINYDNINYA